MVAFGGMSRMLANAATRYAGYVIASLAGCAAGALLALLTGSAVVTTIIFVVLILTHGCWEGVSLVYANAWRDMSLIKASTTTSSFLCIAIWAAGASVAAVLDMTVVGLFMCSLLTMLLLAVSSASARLVRKLFITEAEWDACHKYLTELDS
jgi:hypothetical protein